MTGIARRKPLSFTFIQFRKDDLKALYEVEDFVGNKLSSLDIYADGCVYPKIVTAHGLHKLADTEYIVKNVFGELEVLSMDMFLTDYVIDVNYDDSKYDKINNLKFIPPVVVSYDYYAPIEDRHKRVKIKLHKMGDENNGKANEVCET